MAEQYEGKTAEILESLSNVDDTWLRQFGIKPPLHTQLRGRLNENIAAGDGQKVLDTLNDMRRARYWRAGCFAQALDFFCNTSDLGSAEQVVEMFKILFPHETLDGYKIVKFATLLIKSSRFADALGFLEEQPRLEDPEAKFKINFLVNTLVKTANGTQQQENIRKLTELLASKNFM